MRLEDVAQRRFDLLDALFESQAARHQRRATIVRQCTPHGQAVRRQHPRMLVVAGSQAAFDLPDPSEVLLQLHFGVPVGLVDGSGGLAQEVKLAQLMRHPWEGSLHSVPDGTLPVTDHTQDGEVVPQRLYDLLEERHELILPAAQQGACQQNLTGQHVPEHPQHFVSHVRL